MINPLPQFARAAPDYPSPDACAPPPSYWWNKAPAPMSRRQTKYEPGRTFGYCPPWVAAIRHFLDGHRDNYHETKKSHWWSWNPPPDLSICDWAPISTRAPIRRTRRYYFPQECDEYDYSLNTVCYRPAKYRKHLQGTDEIDQTRLGRYCLDRLVWQKATRY